MDDSPADVPGVLADWHDRASVRVDPRRIFQEESGLGKTFFPHDLIPHLHHEAVAALPRERITDLVAHRLYQYLLFTAHLEVKVVNRATQQIAFGQGGVTDPGVRMDAFKIYCDEAYHALFSVDMVEQIARRTGIAQPPYDFDPILRRLDGGASRYLPDDPLLAQILQVVVFETVVTAILSDVPNDPSVYTMVRRLVADHARDEGRHHRFFAGCFPHIWQAIPAALRPAVARYLPELVHACLGPDLDFAATSLSSAGLDPRTVQDVLRDCYPTPAVVQGIRVASRHTVRLFEQHGVLDVPGGRESFEALGLR